MMLDGTVVALVVCVLLIQAITIYALRKLEITKRGAFFQRPDEHFVSGMTQTKIDSEAFERATLNGPPPSRE